MRLGGLRIVPAERPKSPVFLAGWRSVPDRGGPNISANKTLSTQNVVLAMVASRGHFEACLHRFLTEINRKLGTLGR